MNIISSNGRVQENDSHAFHFEDGFICNILYELEIIEETYEDNEIITYFILIFQREKLRKKE